MPENTKPASSDKIEVDRKEFEALLEQNAQNSALIEQLADNLNRIQSAQLAGIGIDPAIAARSMLPRRMVQFTDHYSRGAVPSAIQKGANVHEPYSVGALDIVNLREDEVKRLQAERPGLIVLDQKKWSAKKSTYVEPGVDDSGRFAYIQKTRTILVEALIQAAQDVG